MRRKLISYDVFEQIQKESLSFAENELLEAESILSRLLGENLQLNFFNTETVVYENSDGTFVHANYDLDDNYLTFDNIEQLVIDSDSEINKAKETLSEMLDAIAGAEQQKAQNIFESYITMPSVKRVFCETMKRRRIPIRKSVGGKTKIVGYKSGYWSVTPKHRELSSTTAKRLRGKKKAKFTTSQSEKKIRASKRSRIKLPHMKEWSNLCENVFDYVNLHDNRHIYNECAISADERGNVVSVKLPTSRVRTEGKILTANWKTLNADVKVFRTNAKKLTEDATFCRAIADLKTHNAISDHEQLEESLANIVSTWPNVLYLTQVELADLIKEALELLNVGNFDDQTCNFMAEGILRVAHDSFTDRVSRVLKLSGKQLSEDESSDKYLEFQDIVNQFYSTLDEGTKLEMQVFVDLYEALRTVHEAAIEEENKLLAAETASYLQDLAAIIQEEAEADLEFAYAAAEYLADIVETNLESEEWKVPNVHTSINGDHPEMTTKSRKGYTPTSDFSGNGGGKAFVSDGKNYKGPEVDELADRGWSNVGGNDTYPTLNNPYLPKSAEYTMKGEKGVDKDSDPSGQWQSGDTWPNLNNPYLPPAFTPKLNQGKEKSVADE